MLILDHYDVILLDMGNTFMFGCDRFGNPDALGRSYAGLAGGKLPPQRAASILMDLYRHSLQTGRDPRNEDAFPSVMQMLRQVPSAAGLEETEIGNLCEVFAMHEVGRVPRDYAAAIHALARTHKLGLISNVWSSRDVFVSALDQAGVGSAFGSLVFSADLGIIKPSRRIFERCLAAFGATPERAVYIGDSFKRDVVGAAAAGIDSVWLTSDATVPEGFTCRPTWIVPNLLSLLPNETR
jgi:putative hydrolase of the HAD superfamily